MTAPPRNSRGGGPPRGRAGTPTPPKARGRGLNSARGGRSYRGTVGSTNARAANLLQGLQSGSLSQRPGASRRDAAQATTRRQQDTPYDQNGQLSSLPSESATPLSQRDYMSHMNSKFQHLKTRRDAERAKAIRDGFLADPEKKTSLDKAITPVGTCTEMCPEFERVERIVQNMVDKAEKIANQDTGRDLPAEGRMIKRFRRSAAGYDEQLPSDIRTPGTLRSTLNYLLHNIVGGEERLATVHKFVWDRTRGIRNDFSIQQVTKEEDVRIAVDCFERIARFHIISLHQLSNPENLGGEHFDAHQEREQLNNTLLSLMYYYDDHRARQKFANEPEFRAYCIIFELQSQQQDLEDRLQSWPPDLLQHSLVSIAFKLYSAAGNTLYDQGPLKPYVPFDIAQGNTFGFWNMLKSRSVTYLMACVAEIYFSQVRFIALQSLWKSIKRAPVGMQAKLQDWTLEELAKLLGFDTDEQALEFCRGYNLGFKANNAGELYLDFTSQPEITLDKSCTPNKQVFSFGIVEQKRYHRTLVAVINGVGVARAIRDGLVVEQRETEDEAEEDIEADDDDSSMFVPERKRDDDEPHPRNPSLMLNPLAPVFTSATSTSLLASPPKSSRRTDFPVVANDAAAAPLYVSGDATSQPLKSILRNGASLKNDIGPQSTPRRANSSVLPSAATNDTKPTSSFGMPSFPASGPSFSVSSITLSAANHAWPSTAVSSIVKSDEPGSDPELIPAQELGTKPLNEPPAIPPSDKSNASSTTLSIEASPLDKPPSSPRPGFRTLSSINNAERARSLFPELPCITEQPPTRAGTDGSNRAPAAFAVSAQTPNGAKEPLTVSSGQPSTSASNPTQMSKSNDTPENRISLNTSQQTCLIHKTQAMKQSLSSKTIGGSPLLTTKSAIPPTFPPNTSPSYTSVTSTKPKHKSPLGSQPPLLATDSTAKRSSPRQPAAGVNTIAHNVATSAFLEPHGILQQFIEHSAMAQIEDALRRFEQEGPLRAAQNARHRLLATKYFTRWYSIYWRRKLNRNASHRREHLAQSIRDERQRKAQGDAELLAILEAQKEKKIIQTEQLQESQQGPSTTIPTFGARGGPQDNRGAGLKRKSLQSDELGPATNGSMPRKVAKGDGHRRSKTMGAVNVISKTSSYGDTATPPHPPRLSYSILSGRPALRKHQRGTTTQGSPNSRKTDSTHTDYFRLKALGVDPETPLIPDTNSSLECKGRRQEDLHLKPRKRVGASSCMKAEVVGRDDSSSSISPRPPRIIGAPERSIDSSRLSEPEMSDGSVDDNDDFIRQIRDVRAAMSEDTEWFRRQAERIGREVEQQEKLRGSASQQSTSSSTGIAAPDTDGGLVRANWYYYAPVVPRSGSRFALSRTEQRIRATGARGLATKSVSDYLPVAMSKLTRATFKPEKEPSQSEKRTGRTTELRKESKYIYQSDEYVEEDANREERSLPSRGARPLSHKHCTASSGYRSQSREEERRVGVEDENGEDALDHSDIDQQRSPNHSDDHYGGEEETEVAAQGDDYVYGSYNGIDDGDEGEDEAETDAVDEHVADEDHSEAGSMASKSSRCHQGPPQRKADPFHMRLRSATPEFRSSPSQENIAGGTQMSRATSGTGVSVDDALVLSD